MSIIEAARISKQLDGWNFSEAYNEITARKMNMLRLLSRVTENTSKTANIKLFSPTLSSVCRHFNDDELFKELDNSLTRMCFQ